MKRFSLVGFVVFLMGAPAFAGCVDLSKSGSYTLTRADPYFEVTNKIANDGTITEERVTKRDGSTQRITTTYWNGVIAVDRKSSSSHIQIKISEDAKAANLNAVGKTYTFPVSILVNGNEVDQGSFVIKILKKTKLPVGGCNYSVMVVRTSLERNNGAPINEEALLSLDAGMLLGNVAMTPEWKARSGVFFDKIKVN